MQNAAARLIEEDKKNTDAVSRYRLWTDRVRFFYPSLQKPTDDDSLTTLRARLIDVFHVIDKYGSKFGELEEQMKNFVYIMMYVIGENRFNSIETHRYHLEKSERYADIVATRHVFTAHKFQDVIYTIRPFTDETKNDLRDRFNYYFKSEYKQAIQQEIDRLESECSKKQADINALEEAKKEYDDVESELEQLSDDIDLTDIKFMDSHTKEECEQILNQYDSLQQAVDKARRKYRNTTSINAYYLNKLRKQRDDAEKALNNFREEHKFSSRLALLDTDDRKELITKYKDLYERYDKLYYKLHDEKHRDKDSVLRRLKKEVQIIRDIIDEKLKPHLQDKHNTEDDIKRMIDRIATNTKEQDELRDEATYLSVDDWLQKHRYDERTQTNQVKKKLEALKNLEKVGLADMNRASREEFGEGVADVLYGIAEKVPVRGTVWLQFHGQSVGTQLRKYTKESFKRLIREWIREGFVIEYEEGFESYYITSNGSKQDRPKVWSLDWFQIHLTDPSQHAPGGTFCPYILSSNDVNERAYCRQKLQLIDHIPSSNDSDILEPCLIHALCESAKNKKGKVITDRQKKILRNSLWSRCLTRFIPVNELANISREFSLRITIYDIDETPLYRFLSGGGSLKWSNNEWIRYDATIHNRTGDKSARHTDYDYDCHICLWEDHYFDKEAAKTLRQLIADNKLEPMKYYANDIFQQVLPIYQPNDLVWQKTMFMTPEQTLDNFNYNHKNQELSSDSSQLGLKMFLEYLVNNKIDMLSMSAVPKKFIQQSVRGGKVSIANGRQQLINEPITGLDVNSLYPFALSNVPAPLGCPRRITEDMSLSDVKKKPVYFVKVYVKTYHRQHELDVPLCEGFHVLNNYDLEYLPIEVDEKQGIEGYYFDKVQPDAFKQFVEELYKRKVAGDKNAKALMNKMIGMFGKKPKEKFSRILDVFNGIKDHPLIKKISCDEDGKTTYEYFCSLDYTYNFVPLYSLVLSKAKMYMEELFRECHNKGIQMFCTSTDSLYVKSEDASKLAHHIDSKQLGKLKIEATADKACFAGYRLYALGSSKIILPNTSGQEFKEKHGDNSFDVFVKKYFRGGKI